MYTYLLLIDSLATHGKIESRDTTKMTVRAVLDPGQVQALQSRFEEQLVSLVGKERSASLLTSTSFDYVRNGLLDFGTRTIAIEVEPGSTSTTRVRISTQWINDDVVTAAQYSTSIYPNDIFQTTMPALSTKRYVPRND